MRELMIKEGVRQGCHVTVVVIGGVLREVKGKVWKKFESFKG